MSNYVNTKYYIVRRGDNGVAFAVPATEYRRIMNERDVVKLGDVQVRIHRLQWELMRGNKLAQLKWALDALAQWQRQDKVRQ